MPGIRPIASPPPTSATGRRRLWALAAAVAAPTALLTVLATHAGDVADAATEISAEAFLLSCLLTLGSLVARTEAWGAVLAAAGSTASRAAVHSASTSLYLLTNVSTQAGHVARIALLRRIAGPDAPPLSAMVVAEAPAAVAAGGASILLALAAGRLLGLPVWAPIIGVLLMVAIVAASRYVVHHFGDRAWAHGLAALAEPRFGCQLAAATAVAYGFMIARMMVVLAAFGSDSSLAVVAVVLLLGGLVNNLPLGGTLGTAAAMSAVGGADLASGAGVGIVLTASTAVASAWYGLGAGAALLVERRRTAAAADAPLAPVVPLAAIEPPAVELRPAA